MIGQLLKITSTPIKLEYSSEPARFEMRSRPLIPFAEVQTTPPEQKIHTENTTVNIDTYQARKSLGYMSVFDSERMAAQRGVQQALAATADAARQGWQLSKGHKDGVTIAQVIGQKMLQQPDMMMKFLPQGGAELSWNPAVCDLDYQMGNVSYQWQRPYSETQYVPSEFNIEVVQKPMVEIEYIGEPMYVPPSSNPNYEEPQ